MDTKTLWLNRINDAGALPDLYAVWQQAVEVDQWDNDLTDAAKRQKAWIGHADNIYQRLTARTDQGVPAEQVRLALRTRIDGAATVDELDTIRQVAQRAGMWDRRFDAHSDRRKAELGPR